MEVQREFICPGTPGEIYLYGKKMGSLHAAAQCREKWKFLAIAVFLVFNKSWVS